MSQALLVQEPMSDTPQNPPEEEQLPPTSTARVDTELMRKARIICAHSKGTGGRRLKLTDYLDSLLRKPIERDYAKVIEQIRHDEETKDSAS